MTPERDSHTLIVVKFNDPIAPGLEPAFRVRVDLGPLDDYGVTRAGHRRVIPITGGLMSGGINGEILPGGADWQLARPDGTLETARSRSAGAILRTSRRCRTTSVRRFMCPGRRLDRLSRVPRHVGGDSTHWPTGSRLQG